MTTSLASEFFFIVLNLFFIWCIAPYMGYFTFGRSE
jgi:hypothetical protein